VRRLLPVLLAGWVVFGILPLPGGAEEKGAEGYRIFEAMAATVNGEVIFLSDVIREECLAKCGVFPGDEPVALSLSASRDRLVADTLVMQEQEKLELGAVDNAVLRETTARAEDILERCPSSCAREILPGQVRDYVERRLLVRDFLRKRVSVFVEVDEEEVQREIQRRASRSGTSPEALSEGTVRKELLEEKTTREIRNWFDRATSKSRILLSPLEER
jgi:DNA segregation ATPase FtsK/SpoIIIE-like protein